MQTNNPIINKYLLNGKYNVKKSEERKNEIKSSNKVIVQHFPVREQMKNGENMYQFGNLKF